MQATAETDPWTMPIEAIDVAQPRLFQDDLVLPYFARMRRDAPVHYCRESQYGPYWSITRFRDIPKIEANHEAFSSSSAFGGITIYDQKADFRMPMFIAMDPPEHLAHRAAISSAVRAPSLSELDYTIRARTKLLLDSLPRDEPFDWVDLVSVELTTQMLSTFMGFPWRDRRMLAYWSDVATAAPKANAEAEAARERELLICLDYFERLRREEARSEPSGNLISMLIHAPATRNMSPMEFLGNIVLLIVGGSDTMRNSLTGSLLALHRYPDEYAKLQADPALVDSLIPEIVRWETPLAHMRRTALHDIEFEGHQIHAGDKVVLWYLSANRDETAIPQADRFLVGRTRPRRHLGFGFGIHRCFGEKLAELQLRIFWEEMLRRVPNFEILQPPERVYSVFVRGYARLMVRIP